MRALRPRREQSHHDRVTDFCRTFLSRSAQFGGSEKVKSGLNDTASIGSPPYIGPSPTHLRASVTE
jgi:hypothetical protein